MVKESDGFHVVTIHAKDAVFRKALVEGMKAQGYEPYSFSQHEDDRVQYAFVTEAKKAELHEVHLHSCRNSLGKAEEILGKKPGLIDGIIGKLRRGRLANRSQDDVIVIAHSKEVSPDHLTVVVDKERLPDDRKREYLRYGPTGKPSDVDELELARQRALLEDDGYIAPAVETFRDMKIPRFQSPEEPPKEKTYSEQRAEHLETQQRERQPFHEPYVIPSRSNPAYEQNHYRHSAPRDDDDRYRRSSPAPISIPDSSSYDSGGSDGGGGGGD